VPKCVTALFFVMRYWTISIFYFSVQQMTIVLCCILYSSRTRHHRVPVLDRMKKTVLLHLSSYALQASSGNLAPIYALIN